MPAYLFKVRMRRKVNGADFLLDRIEAKDSAEAELQALQYLGDGLDINPSNYTVQTESKQEIGEA
jgi:hypothetical protein